MFWYIFNIQLYNLFPEDTILDLLSILLAKSVHLLIKLVNNASKWTFTKHEALFTHIISWIWQRFFNRDPPYKLMFHIECTLINGIKLTYTNHKTLFTHMIVWISQRLFSTMSSQKQRPKLNLPYQRYKINQDHL